MIRVRFTGDVHVLLLVGGDPGLGKEPVAPDDLLSQLRGDCLSMFSHRQTWIFCTV